MSSGGSNRKIMPVGSVFHHLNLVSEPVSVGGKMVGDFKCVCGAIKAIITSVVARELVKSCGCMRQSAEVIKKRTETMCNTKRIIPDTGERFSSLVFDGSTSTVNIGGKIRFMGYFECDCGAVICREMSSVRAGKIKSCGCMSQSPETSAARVASARETLAAKSNKTNLPRRVIAERHNYDASPRRDALSIGSSLA